MTMRAIRGWSCFCLRLDHFVCGGPPQFSSFWLGITTERRGCWWFGSRFFRRTGGRPAAQRLAEFQTTVCDSFGTRTIWSPVP